jgi:hypothetical protein
MKLMIQNCCALIYLNRNFPCVNAAVERSSRLRLQTSPPSFITTVNIAIT